MIEHSQLSQLQAEQYEIHGNETGLFPPDALSNIALVSETIRMQGEQIDVNAQTMGQLAARSRDLKATIAIACKFQGRSPYTFDVGEHTVNDLEGYARRMQALSQPDLLPDEAQRLARATLKAMSIDYALRRHAIHAQPHDEQPRLVEASPYPVGQVAMPVVEKRVLIEQPTDSKFLPDGRINQQYYIGCPGVWHDQETGETVIYFKGTDPYFKDPTDPAEVKNREAVSGIYAAILKKDGTIAYFDGEGTVDPETGEGRYRELADRTDAYPVIAPLHPERGQEDGRFEKLAEIRERLDEKKAMALASGRAQDAALYDSLLARLPSDQNSLVNYARHGQEDIRLTQIEKYGVFIGAANTLNKDLLKPAKVAADSLDDPIYGAYPELYIMGDPRNPDTIVSLGDIGPVEYFKNVIFHPETIDINNEPHLLIYMRKLPDIQAITIPVREVFALAHDPEYRRAFWEDKLNEESLEENTILKPMHPWEGANNPNNPEGQIAGGSPPMLVEYPDRETGENKEGWLLVYNSVPEFDEKGGPHGRLIGLALLDKDNPWKVVSRLPHPFVTPTTDAERMGRYDRDIVFATGSYIDTDGTLHILYTGGDINVSDAYCDAGQAIRYLASHDEHGNPPQSV